MIRKAQIAEIDSILKITKACATKLISKNIEQWNTSYPNKIVFENDIARQALYVLEISGALVGCIVISKRIDTEYKDVIWLTPNTKNLYIHRLAIHPDFQGKGWAQKLMDFAEEFALKHKFTSIRLDTFSKNTKNQKFYELRGYKKLGSVYFFNQSTHPFYCYEYIL